MIKLFVATLKAHRDTSGSPSHKTHIIEAKNEDEVREKLNKHYEDKAKKLHHKITISHVDIEEVIK
jgi:hypothetical protein